MQLKELTRKSTQTRKVPNSLQHTVNTWFFFSHIKLKLFEIELIRWILRWNPCHTKSVSSRFVIIIITVIIIIIITITIIIFTVCYNNNNRLLLLLSSLSSSSSSLSSSSSSNNTFRHSKYLLIADDVKIFHAVKSSDDYTQSQSGIDFILDQ